MTIHPDFEELLKLLERHGVEYMIIAQAVSPKSQDEEVRSEDPQQELQIMA